MLYMRKLLLCLSVTFLFCAASVSAHTIQVYAGAYVDAKEAPTLKSGFKTSVETWEKDRKKTAYEKLATPIPTDQPLHVSLAQGAGDAQEVLTFFKELLAVFPKDGKLVHTVGSTLWPKTSHAPKGGWIGVGITLPKDMDQFLEKWVPAAKGKSHMSTHINLWGEWKLTPGFKNALLRAFKEIKTTSLLVRYTEFDTRLDVWVVAPSNLGQAVQCFFYKEKVPKTFELNSVVQFSREAFVQKMDALLKQKGMSLFVLTQKMFQGAKPLPGGVPPFEV